jgi:hypothetical protein
MPDYPGNPDDVSGGLNLQPTDKELFLAHLQPVVPGRNCLQMMISCSVQITPANSIYAGTRYIIRYSPTPVQSYTCSAN